jgi:hypothetical protein
MAGKDDEHLRTELIRLKFGIFEKYEAPDPDSRSIRDARAPFCDFCGKALNEVQGMVEGRGGHLHMCNECVLVAHQILFDASSD